MASECNYPAAVLGSIFGTFIVCVIFFVLLYFLFLRRRKKPKTSERDTESVEAFDNKAFDDKAAVVKKTESFADRGFPGYTPCKEYTSEVQQAWLTGQRASFRKPKKTKEAKIINGSIAVEKNDIGSSSRDDSQHHTPFSGTVKEAIERNKLFSQNQPISVSKTRRYKYGSKFSLDDTCLDTLEPIRLVDVGLESSDITGLGFNINGSLRDGIFVSQIMDKGPATQSGKIQTGDRILGVTISFRHIVYEDALTILSYASPYSVNIQLQKSDPIVMSGEAHVRHHQAHFGSLEDLNHPLYRSQSVDDLRNIGSESGDWCNKYTMQRDSMDKLLAFAKTHYRKPSGGQDSTSGCTSSFDNDEDNEIPPIASAFDDENVKSEEIFENNSGIAIIESSTETAISSITDNQVLTNPEDESSFVVPDTSLDATAMAEHVLDANSQQNGLSQNDELTSAEKCESVVAKQNKENILNEHNSLDGNNEVAQNDVSHLLSYEDSVTPTNELKQQKEAKSVKIESDQNRIQKNVLIPMTTDIIANGESHENSQTGEQQQQMKMVAIASQLTNEDSSNNNNNNLVPSTAVISKENNVNNATVAITVDL